MIIKVCIFALCGIIVLSLVKHTSGGYVALIQIGVVVSILIFSIPEIKALADSVGQRDFLNGVSTEGIKIMIKIFAILACGSICADICRDNGESAIADTVELSSKIISVSMAIPVITAVVSIAMSFLKG